LPVTLLKLLAAVSIAKLDNNGPQQRTLAAAENRLEVKALPINPNLSIASDLGR